MINKINESIEKVISISEVGVKLYHSAWTYTFTVNLKQNIVEFVCTSERKAYSLHKKIKETGFLFSELTTTSCAMIWSSYEKKRSINDTGL